MPTPSEDAPTFKTTARSRVRRRPQRAHYDEAAVFAILDAGILAHVGYVLDGQPFVTPTAYWRDGRRLYWHGAAASRMLRTVAEGAPVCVTVSFLDGLIVGRSGMVHSLNYRSVMAFGRARPVEGEAGKRKAMHGLIDRLYPGRADRLRPMTSAELGQIALVEMEIDEASAKVRDAGVADLAADDGWPAWSGVLPVETRTGAPRPEPGVEGAPTPDLARYAEGGRLDAALNAAAEAYRGLPVST